MSKQKNILVLNQYNSDNLGDQLLNKLLCEKLSEFGMKTINAGYAQTIPQSVNYVYEDNISMSNFVKFKSYCPSSIKYIFRFRNRLKKTAKQIQNESIDAIVIGGGQLLKSRSVFINCFSFWVKFAKKNDIPIFVFGIGVDDYLTMWEKKMYSALLSKVEYVNCRDVQSKTILAKQMGIKKCDLSPDVVFSFSFKEKCIQKKNIFVIMPYSYNTAKSSFAFSLSHSEYFNMLLKKILQKQDKNLKIVLAATTSADAYECFLFKKFLDNKKISSEIYEITKIEQLVKLYMKTKLLISGRMHAMIIANKCGVQVDPIIISSKIRDYKNDYLDKKLDYENVSHEACEGIERLVQAMEK